MIHELVDQVNAVLDGEIVAVDGEGRTSFELLQQRMNLQNEREIKRVAKQIPVAFVVFDLLWLDGHDVTDLALQERRELLELIVEEDHRLQLMSYEEGDGKAFVRGAQSLGLEGVVAKRMGSKYLPGRRSPDWRKIKLISTQDCVILGWTAGQGGRSGSFGALLVGAIDDGELRWVGQVGTGFGHQMLDRLMDQLTPLVREDPADRRPLAPEGEGSDVRGTRARVRGRVPRDHEVLGEDARAVLPRACGRTRRRTNASSSRRRSTRSGRSDRPRQARSVGGFGRRRAAQNGSKPARTSIARTSRSSIPLPISSW